MCETKIREKIIPVNTVLKKSVSYQKIVSKNNDSLDKLAQLDTNKEKWKRKAKRKAIATSMSKHLLTVKGSHLKKSFINTFYCTDQVLQLRYEAKVKRCKNRWCPVCQSIYAGKLMNGYKPSIEAMKEPYFLTLTIVSVPGYKLKDSFKQMKTEFTNVTRTLKTRSKRGGNYFDCDAIRKLECNYNSTRKTFNPHFHILIDGKNNAEMIRREWLKRNTKLNPKAQKLKPADPETVGSELFKYVVKAITKDEFVPSAQVEIFEALYKQRIYQTYGSIKRLDEKITDHESTTINWKDDRVELYQWQQRVYDWISESGEPLTDYIPTAKDQTLINRLKDIENE